MKSLSIVSFALGLISVPIACGGGGSSVGASSGLPRSSTIASLTPDQAGILCDWTNGKQGGYGRAVTCADGSQQGTDPDKTSCVQSIADFGAACPTLIVADVEDCANAIGSNVCGIATAMACANLKQCFDMLGI